MANLTTTSDLKTYVLEGMRELTDGTSPWDTKVLTQLNRCYRAMWAGGVGLGLEIGAPVTFPWARAQYPKVVTLLPPVTTGTAQVTNGSTAVVLGTVPSASVAGWHLKVDGEPEVYRVVSDDLAGNLVIDSAYAGTTSLTATFVLFKCRYTLSADVLAVCSPIMAYSTQGSYEIDVVAKSVLNRDWPLALIEEDMPNKAGIVYQQEGTVEVQFNAYPDETERVEIEYIAVPTALDLVGSDPLMPIHQRVVVAEFALAYLLEEVDDDRAATHLKAARDGFTAMVEEARGLMSAGSRNAGRIVARLDEYDGGWTRYVTTDDGFIIDLGS